MASAAPMGRFEVSGVFRRMVSGISAQWKILLGIALGVGVIASVIGGTSMASVLQSYDPTNPGTVLSIFGSPLYWVAAGGSMLLSAFSMSAMLATLLKPDGEGDTDFAAAFANGIRNVLSMVGLTILWWLGLMVGYILIIVPSLILLTMWSVSAPVLIAERTGVIGAFGRSRALTKGIRWPVFGALLLFLIVYLVIASALQGFSQVGMLNLYKSNMTGAIAVGLISSSLLGILLNAFLAGLYGEVLAAKEGGSRNELAEVFA